jgi:hypothetical protein
MGLKLSLGTTLQTRGGPLVTIKLSARTSALTLPPTSDYKWISGITHAGIIHRPRGRYSRRDTEGFLQIRQRKAVVQYFVLLP